MNIKNILIGLVFWSLALWLSVFLMRSYNENPLIDKNQQVVNHKSSITQWFIEIPNNVKTKNSLKKAGYKLSFSYNLLNEKLISKLRVGPYENKEKADAEQKNIQKRFKLKTIVMRIIKKDR
ncbi:hypothetical protein MNB_SUP05-5-514 [hydrothermal vent metagenome]|uniref:SPOR domain-containing protein n=1 Tax=hydrothermal vent metagenome TaxID=652676 RepID=A0A1W1CS24_9ZZZZ